MATYTLHNQATTAGLAASSVTTGRTVASGFTVSYNCSLTGIWFRSATQSVILPTACAIYDSANQSTPVAINSSPSWSGAAASGWVKCTFDGSVTLQTGKTYYVCAFSAGGSKWWSSATTFPAAMGGGTPWASAVVSGPLNGLIDNGTTPALGQDTTNNGTSSIGYPNHLVQHNTDNGIDVEVTDLATGVTLTGSVTATATFAGGVHYSHTLSGNVSVDTFGIAATASRAHTLSGSVGMNLTPAGVISKARALGGNLSAGSLVTSGSINSLAPVSLTGSVTAGEWLISGDLTVPSAPVSLTGSVVAGIEVDGVLRLPSTAGGFPFGSTVQVTEMTFDPRTGDRTAGLTTTYSGVAVWTVTSTETEQNADTSITALSAMFPVGATITSTSIVTIDGVAYESVGQPIQWRSAFTGWKPGVQVGLRIVNG